MAKVSYADLTPQAEETARQVTDVVDQCWVQTQHQIEAKPVQAAVWAFIAGAIFGLVWASRPRRRRG